MSAALQAEWHDASVEMVAWEGSALLITLRIWIHDAAAGRYRLHPALLKLESAKVEGPLVAGYDLVGGSVSVADRRWDDMVPMPFTLRGATFHWNEGCSGPLAPVTVTAESATLEVTGPATAEEPMP